MWCKRSFPLVIAALCLSGAAILPSASSALAQRRTNKRKPAATGATKSAPTSAPTVPPDPTPAPAKANSRPVDEQTATPTPTPQIVDLLLGEKKNDAAHDGVRYYYEFTQPDFYLQHIQIEHDAAGHGQMTFVRKGDFESYTEPLTISPAALARIMSAWTALGFLDSTENYQTDRQMAHLGTMRLRVTDGARTRTAEFNWTHNPHAAALTNEYRRLAEQTLFVFEVEVARQYQPSDTVKLLKGLEMLINRDGISDAAQLVSLLKDLSTDERIPLIARNQAERLSKKITK
jgi:hypothetical protein